MNACANHPKIEAIEQCEQCVKPLCGLCLWYTDDGHRLCEEHAKEAEAEGATITSPDAYAEAIPASLSQTNDTSEEDAGQGKEHEGFKVYSGNQQDIGAFVAAILGATTLASCAGGAYCFPLLGVIMALLAYANADKAVDPERTRKLALVGIGIGGLILLAVVFFILFYIILMGGILFSSSISSP